ncbi:MAG TPA: hypothetical protein PLP74_14165, partial [Quisquiliibacterium sp.]|nr:hypothetical protein [Quisquiliibacterium sp.]
MARRSSCGDRTRLVVRWRRAWSGSGCRGGQAGMMDPAGWAALLEASSIGAWMRTSARAYPLVNLAHLLGLVLLVGPILLLDLRLLGFGRRLPLDAVSALLIPWCIVGLLLLLGSGVLLFAADATPLFSNTLLRVKLLLIGLGTGNAWCSTASGRPASPTGTGARRLPAASRSPCPSCAGSWRP